MQGNSYKFARLKAGNASFSGSESRNTAAYYVTRDLYIEDGFFAASMQDGETGVRVRVKLCRRAVSELVTTILPTACICIVAFATNFFKVKSCAR